MVIQNMTVASPAAIASAAATTSAATASAPTWTAEQVAERIYSVIYISLNSFHSYYYFT